MDFFQHTPLIRAKRLHLRKITLKDANDIFEYSKDPLVAEHVLWDAHRSVSDTKGYIRWMMRKYRFGEPSSWGIALNENDKVIGTIGFMWIQPENAAAEVGYSLSRVHWNKGYMTEALHALLEYGFDHMHLNRIEAMHETGNPASGAVMRKCGMQKEGTLRSKVFNKGKYVDVDLYAILRKDFR